MQKAVAIPYIIALVLGIAVIGLVGFWFFKTGGKFGSQSLEVECQAKVFSYCLAWQSKSACDNDDRPALEVCDNLPSEAKCKEIDFCK